MTILSKKQMSEEDIKLQYITHAILKEWDKSRITMETKITDGQIKLRATLFIVIRKVQSLPTMFFTGTVAHLWQS